MCAIRVRPPSKRCSVAIRPADTLSGGAGNDTFVLAGNLTAADKIDGGADNDTLQLSGNYTAGVYGCASATTGMTYGVWGDDYSTSTFGIGVLGISHATTGQTYGVYGRTESKAQTLHHVCDHNARRHLY